MEQIILASGSKRRQEFLKLLALPFNCIPSNVDESFNENLAPGAIVEELALRKVLKVAETMKFEAPPWICGADTIIYLEGRIYGKPVNREDARRILSTLQGKTHEVWTAVALYNGRKKTTDCRSVCSHVSFAVLSDAEIKWYLDSFEWQDAAGAYKLQGLASCLITEISGSFSSIVGLPIREFYVMLRDNGYPFGG